MKKQRGQTPTIPILNSVFFTAPFNKHYFNSHLLRFFHWLSLWSVQYEHQKTLSPSCKGLDGENGTLASIHPCPGHPAIPLALSCRGKRHPGRHCVPPAPPSFTARREVIALQTSNSSLALIRFTWVKDCTNVYFNRQQLTRKLYVPNRWIMLGFPFMLLNAFLTLFARK